MSNASPHFPSEKDRPLTVRQGIKFAATPKNHRRFLDNIKPRYNGKEMVKAFVVAKQYGTKDKSALDFSLGKVIFAVRKLLTHTLAGKKLRL